MLRCLLRPRASPGSPSAETRSQGPLQLDPSGFEAFLRIQFARLRSRRASEKPTKAPSGFWPFQIRRSSSRPSVVGSADNRLRHTSWSGTKKRVLISRSSRNSSWRVPMYPHTWNFETRTVSEIGPRFASGGPLSHTTCHDSELKRPRTSAARCKLVNPPNSSTPRVGNCASSRPVAALQPTVATKPIVKIVRFMGVSGMGPWSSPGYSWSPTFRLRGTVNTTFRSPKCSSPFVLHGGHTHYLSRPYAARPSPDRD